MKKKKIGKGTITALIIGFVMSVTIFFVLTIIQRELLKDTERTVVVMAKKPIPAGTVITENNVSEYLKEEAVSSSLAIQETYKLSGDLAGMYVTRNVAANEILYSGLVGNDTENLKKYKKPIELSLNISEEASAVAGTIRKNDSVNVYVCSQNEENGQLYELVLEAICVNEVYNENMEKIEMADEVSVALTFTFYMEQELVPDLLKKLESKEIFVVKVK